MKVGSGWSCLSSFSENKIHLFALYNSDLRDITKTGFSILTYIDPPIWSIESIVLVLSIGFLFPGEYSVKWIYFVLFNKD